MNIQNCKIIITALFLLSSNYVCAAPTGKDLFNACNISLESGFNSIEGQMCTWYLLPCNCDINTDLPQVCLPENTKIDVLAQIVIDEIDHQPELQGKYAALSAATILSKHYPCTGK